MSPWVEVTLSLQEALHHLQCPREERKKGSVNTAIFVSTVKLVFFSSSSYLQAATSSNESSVCCSAENASVTDHPLHGVSALVGFTVRRDL